MRNFILTLDEGTTGIQASLFSTDNFTMYGNNKIEFSQIYQSAGLVEHNPEEIWQVTLQALAVCLAKAKIEAPDFTTAKILSIGITNQRETCVAWNKLTGEVAGNAIVWQDRRTAEFCNSFKADESIRQMILQKTGLVCDPYFSASKMKWMLEEYPKAKHWNLTGELALGTIDCYILFKLTKGRVFATDHTNASRTMLYNIHTGMYDADLLKLFTIPIEALPEIKPGIGYFGTSNDVPQLPTGIPVTGILGDQQSALFGQNCLGAGNTKITFGTGAFLLMNIGTDAVITDNGLLTTVAYNTDNKTSFALEGSAFIAGAAVQMLRDNFGWIENSAQSAELAINFPRDEALLFVPSLSGLGAPYWNPQARGVLFGLSRGTHKSQIIRAVLESIAMQNVQLLHIMEQISGQKINHVSIDGGASRNDFLMQLQADLLQTRLVRPQNIETTSLGVAKAAYMGISKITPEAFKSDEPVTEFKPQIPATLANVYLYRWLKAVDCVNAFYSENAG